MRSAAAMPDGARSSVFSSLRHVFHSPSAAVGPDPPPPSSSSLHLFQAFESSLALRLSSLPDSPCLTIASLCQFLRALLATQADLSALAPGPPAADRPPLSPAELALMTDFLDRRSLKLLDLCRAIKEQISVADSLQSMLRAVLPCLSGTGGAAQAARARKLLTELLLHMEIESADESQVCKYRSFRLKCRGDGSGGALREPPQRWRSWHGSSRILASPSASNLSDSNPSMQLQELLSALPAPKLLAGDADSFFSAAMYALNLVSVFFLGTLSASLPSLDRVLVPTLMPPRTASWSQPLLRLQDRVQEELKCRCKNSNSYAGMWELHQIATILSRLFDLTEDNGSPQEENVRDEVKNLVKQLKQHVGELDRDMGQLYSQLMDFYNNIISSRMDVLDKFSDLRP